MRNEIVAEELPGVLNWAIVGLATLQINHTIFPHLKAGEAAKEKHRAVCDHERTFLLEHCKESTGSYIESRLLYEIYKDWMLESGYRSAGRSKFNRAVERCFCGAFQTREQINHNQKMKWLNLTQTN